MKHLQYTELSLNGHRLEGDAIVEMARTSEEKNIRAIGTFMQEWLNESDQILIQTSGSTGAPKVIEVQKSQMLQSAAATAKFFKFHPGQMALLALPMQYIAGKMMVVRALYSKLNLICIEPDSHPLEKLSQHVRVDFAPLTPMQLSNTSNTKSVHTILLGGGPISSEQEESFQRLSAEIYHGYGMTETLSHVALRKVNGKDRSVAYAGLPGVIFDLDGRGCLTIDVPFLSEKVVTNDLATLIDDHHFIWKGRLDNIVNSGGVKLYPEQIEARLYPYIAQQFFVAGLADEVLGERLCLFIEGSEWEGLKMNELLHNIEYCLKSLERPKAIYFIDRFLMTASGKIKRKETLGLI
ncbi:MAG: AMP-binding protein [Saprospiraceae bacterium]|nr:MAG: long-chain-fatty-acid--CoA ligase [Bacteroidetes bacterium OLB9]MCO6463720.1 AMP-binding protein [Saprospiraceae bacterium]MCZ2337433.1 AMP-binding protein [Chitinophagales bacterium]